MNSLFPAKRMVCVADENIPYVEDAFSVFGKVRLVSGRNLTSGYLKDADILLVRSVTRVDEDLLRDTKVKFVASATIGIDHIDHTFLKNNNIGFSYAPGSNADSVAEYILAALAFLSRKNGKKFSDMTLGIIGVGNIGSRVFKNALTLGMKTVLCDPPKERTTHCSLYRPLEEVLETADILSLHVPLENDGEDATRNMVNRTFLEKMKPGTILINTSRGGIVDEQSLLAMRHKLGGLVLDVWQGEPAINTVLVKMAIIATPHIAGYSCDGKIRGTVALYKAANAFFYQDPQWQLSESVFCDKKGVVDLTESETTIADAILSAYPIDNDDTAFRKIISMDERRRLEYFDELRKNYPKRYEFPHFTINKNNADPVTLGILENLRFTIE